MEISPLNNKLPTSSSLSLPGPHQTNPKVNKGQQKDLDNDEAQRKRLRVVKERW